MSGKYKNKMTCPENTKTKKKVRFRSFCTDYAGRHGSIFSRSVGQTPFFTVHGSYILLMHEVFFVPFRFLQSIHSYCNYLNNTRFHVSQGEMLCPNTFIPILQNIILSRFMHKLWLLSDRV